MLLQRSSRNRYMGAFRRCGIKRTSPPPRPVIFSGILHHSTILNRGISDRRDRHNINKFLITVSPGISKDKRWLIMIDWQKMTLADARIILYTECLMDYSRGTSTSSGKYVSPYSSINFEWRQDDILLLSGQRHMTIFVVPSIEACIWYQWAW